MNKKEFLEKYKIHFETPMEELSTFIVLDNLYTQFTKEQVLEIVGAFYDNADELFNDTKEAIMSTIAQLKELFGSGEFDDDLEKSENEVSLDKGKMN